MVVSTFLAGLAIFWGALMVIIWQAPSERLLAFLLAFAAGVMVAVAGLDLLPAAWQASGIRGTLAGGLGGFGIMGILQLLLSRRFGAARSAGVLVFTGVALHDILEGVAVAIGFQMAEELGIALAAAIGLHHVPEGIAMAVPLKHSGVGSGRILALAFLTSLMTPFGVWAGGWLVQVEASMMGAFLAAAAGAMLYLAFGELLPEALAQKNGPTGAGGFVLGLGLMGIFLLCC